MIGAAAAASLISGEFCSRTFLRQRYFLLFVNAAKFRNVGLGKHFVSLEMAEVSRYIEYGLLPGCRVGLYRAYCVP